MEVLLQAATGQEVVTFGPQELVAQLARSVPPPDGEAEPEKGWAGRKGSESGPGEGLRRSDGRRQTDGPRRDGRHRSAPARRRGALPLLEPSRGEVWAGVDEAGRGPLAGPLVACALVPGPCLPPGLADSKNLSAGQRERLWWQILRACRDVRVAVAPPAFIDREGIHRATLDAMVRAADALTAPFHCLWVDGPFRLGLGRPVHQHALVDADARIACVAAASVVAKVVRDAIMVALDGWFPGYQLARHKGYPTAEHRRALERLGPCAIHRMSFRLLGREAAGL